MIIKNNNNFLHIIIILFFIIIFFTLQYILQSFIVIILFQRHRRFGFIANKFAYRLQNGFGNDLWNSDLGSDSSCDSLHLRGKRELPRNFTKK